MLIYSVAVNIENEIHEEWYEWMTEKHIPDVMATGHFTNYRIYRLLSPEPEKGLTYIINYECPSMEDYERYQIENAAILQKEHGEKFGGKFTATRSLMEML
ncbi:MAG: DUF4286 family protein [Ignavibacteria bacterium]|nr:DUF4286 family protein [Ignavibacteria bacterium]